VCREAERAPGWAHLALLLARGASFDEDLNGHSPLSQAAQRGHLRCVELLVDRELATGGLQTIRTAGSYRPQLEGIRRIDMALLGATDPRVIELLVRRGADVALVDRLRR
jgi:ankyrin repeat protein